MRYTYGQEGVKDGILDKGRACDKCAVVVYGTGTENARHSDKKQKARFQEACRLGRNAQLTFGICNKPFDGGRAGKRLHKYGICDLYCFCTCGHV